MPLMLTFKSGATTFVLCRGHVAFPLNWRRLDAAMHVLPINDAEDGMILARLIGQPDAKLVEFSGPVEEAPQPKATPIVDAPAYPGGRWT